MARTYQAIKLLSVSSFIPLVFFAGELRASELLSQGKVPRCDAVAEMIESGHITLAKGLAINCNPVSAYCEVSPEQCSSPPPVMTYKKYCSRTSDVPCSGGRVIY
jgi:hypothetical protein